MVKALLTIVCVILLPTNTLIDRLVVLKSKLQLLIYQGEALIKMYPISLGFNPIGHKPFEGDDKTPEG